MSGEKEEEPKKGDFRHAKKRITHRGRPGALNRVPTLIAVLALRSFGLWHHLGDQFTQLLNDFAGHFSDRPMPRYTD